MSEIDLLMGCVGLILAAIGAGGVIGSTRELRRMRKTKSHSNRSQ